MSFFPSFFPGHVDPPFSSCLAWWSGQSSHFMAEATEVAKGTLLFQEVAANRPIGRLEGSGSG